MSETDSRVSHKLNRTVLLSESNELLTAVELVNPLSENPEQLRTAFQQRISKIEFPISIHATPQDGGVGVFCTISATMDDQSEPIDYEKLIYRRDQVLCIMSSIGVARILSPEELTDALTILPDRWVFEPNVSKDSGGVNHE